MNLKLTYLSKSEEVKCCKGSNCIYCEVLGRHTVQSLSKLSRNVEKKERNSTKTNLYSTVCLQACGKECQDFHVPKLVLKSKLQK